MDIQQMAHHYFDFVRQAIKFIIPNLLDSE